MVGRVLRLVYKEVRGLHQAAYVLALFAFSSQLLALVRDRVLAHQFGAGLELDIYYAAFRVPDLLYVLFASSLSVYVLIPFVSERLKNGDQAAKALLSQVATVFLVSYTAIAAIMWVLAPQLVPFIAPGLTPVGDEVVGVMRVLLLQPLFLGFSSLLGVVTQLAHRFVLYALSPLLYNIGIIVGIVAFYPFMGLSGLAFGVVLGAVMHMAVQLPLVQQGSLAIRLTRKIDWAQIWTIFKVSAPRAFTLAIQQLVMVCFVALASMMAVGSVAVFQFAFNLQSVPLAVIGASYSIAAFPLLAQQFAEGKFDTFRQHILSALRHIVFWSVPILVLIIVLRAQLVRVVLGSGAFDWADTRLTAAVLALFCVSLVAQAFNLLIVRTFYAGGYTKLPLLITSLSALGAVGVTYAAYIFGAVESAWFATFATLLRVDDVSGAEVLLLALGYSLMMLVQAALLLGFAAKTFQLPIKWLLLHVVRSAAAALVGGAFAYAMIQFIVDGVNNASFLGIFIQGLFGGIAGVVGVVATYFVLRSPELKEIAHSFRRKLFTTDIIAAKDDVL